MILPFNHLERSEGDHMPAESTLTTSATSRDTVVVPGNVDYKPLPPRGRPHATYWVPLSKPAERRRGDS